MQEVVNIRQRAVSFLKFTLRSSVSRNQNSLTLCIFLWGVGINLVGSGEKLNSPVPLASSILLVLQGCTCVLSMSGFEYQENLIEHVISNSFHSSYAEERLGYFLSMVHVFFFIFTTIKVEKYIKCMIRQLIHICQSTMCLFKA